MTTLNQKWQTRTAEIIDSCRGSYGHIEGITDAQCVALALSNVQHHLGTMAQAWDEIRRLKTALADAEANRLTIGSAAFEEFMGHYPGDRP